MRAVLAGAASAGVVSAGAVFSSACATCGWNTAAFSNRRFAMRRVLAWVAPGHRSQHARAASTGAPAFPANRDLTIGPRVDPADLLSESQAVCTMFQSSGRIRRPEAARRSQDLPSALSALTCGVSPRVVKDKRSVLSTVER